MEKLRSTLRALEHVYDAAIDGRLWPEALESMVEAIGAQCGMLIDASSAPNGLLAACGMDDDAAILFRGELVNQCPSWIKHLPYGIPTPQSARISDVDFERSHLYQQCVRKVDGFYGMITPLAQTGTQRLFVAGRLRGLQDFNTVDVQLAAHMVPHIQKALAIRRHLDISAAEMQSVYETLSQVDVGVILLDACLRPVFVNAQAERISALGDSVLIGRSGVSAACPTKSAQLQAAIAQTRIGEDIGRPHPGCVLDRRAPKPPLLVTASPFRPDGIERPDHISIMLILTNAPRSAGAGPNHLALSCYRLTHREAVLAELLVEGVSLREAADRMEVTVLTARTYLKRLLSKTDTHRQSELVIALLRSSPPLHL